MLISLVQTSQDRRKELIFFVESLNAQERVKLKDIQLIFIDQGENRDIFDKLDKRIELTYIKTKHCSLSHARNIGLKYVKGQYIGFPDDDCWYEPETLKLVLQYLQQGKYQGVTGKGTNENGIPTSIFPNSSSELTVEKRCAAISYTIFLKFCPDIKFDEIMGVGSPYNIGAGEETDYLLMHMEKYKYRIFYDPLISIHHPTSNIYDKKTILSRSYSYARGAGYLMQKHKFSIAYKIKQFVRPIGGMIIHILKGDYFSFRKSYLIFKGRLEGYFFRIKK